MAQNTIPSESVMAKKNALLAQPEKWATVRDPKTGQRSVKMQNLTGTRVYTVDPAGRACNCRAGQNGLLCAHRLAVIERSNHDALRAWESDGWEMIPAADIALSDAFAQQARAEAARPARKTYAELMNRFEGNVDAF